MELGDKVLPRFFFLTALFLDEHQRRLLAVSVVEVLGRGGRDRVAVDGRHESYHGFRRGEGSGGWADARGADLLPRGGVQAQGGFRLRAARDARLLG